MIQDNEQTLEKIKKESIATIAAKQEKIDEVNRNIEMLKISKRERKKKHKYYMNVLKSEENPHSSISVLPDSKSGTLQTIQSKPGD